MISCVIEEEDHFKKYLMNANSIYRPAPSEIINMVGGPCGILLQTTGK